MDRFSVLFTLPGQKLAPPPAKAELLRSEPLSGSISRSKTWVGKEGDAFIATAIRLTDRRGRLQTTPLNQFLNQSI